MKIFNLPDLGEGLPDAEIHEWHVKEGDIVKADQVMVSMETAKAVVEVPAPRAGKIVKLYGKQGDVIDTGKPLVEFEVDNTEDAENQNNDTENAATVAGAIEVGNRIIQESATGIKTKKVQGGIAAVPAVRHLAHQLDVDINTIVGTGPGGLITANDVQQAAEGPSQAPEGFAPLQGVRRHMAQTMTESHTQVVPVVISDVADIHTWHEGSDITARVIRALIHACETEPGLNAWYHGKSVSKRIFSKVNLGIAMDSPDGLFVPVLHDAAKQSPTQWRETINRFKTQLKDRSIPAEDLRDSTIMLSNFGTFAGRYANPVVVPPNVAILGTGRIFTQLALHNKQAVEHRFMPLSLSFDHRACTGGEAARFLATVIADLEKAE